MGHVPPASLPRSFAPKLFAFEVQLYYMFKNALFRRLHKRYASYSQAETLSKYPIGLLVHGFTISHVQPIPEFSLVAVKLKHTRTGLEHLHLDNPSDKNNVFAVALKTNPPDFSGVPHILEHTTLCGSYKYPVRDPFFKMLNRSLSNFMNAMTGHDYTYYPFATTNAKDYNNLMDVYLSSVFEPLLTYEDFTQEGWRLEQSDMSDSKSPIEFKGVVYNEMKGQYSNSSYLYWIKFQESIYASLNNSGGDPAKMTNLQYEDLIDFHATNYHPSNARTFTYGTFTLNEHLEKLNEFYKPFGLRSMIRKVKESIFDLDPAKTHNIEVTGPVDTMTTKSVEEQLKTSITWHLGNPLDDSMRYDVFKWKVLNSLLCDGHSSPFYQELIETGYGEDFSPNSGFDLTTSLMSFTIGVSNVSREKVDGLANKVTDILKLKVVPELEKGSESLYHERVEAILHQLELGFKKDRPDFGLGLLNSIVPSWVNGLDPVKSLQVENILNRFKEDYEENGVAMFQEMLESTLLNENIGRFTFTMVPEANFNQNLVDEEAERLQEKVKNLTSEDKEIIYERSKQLLEKQQAPSDVSVLPTLTLADIPRKADVYDLSFSTLANEGNKIQKRIVNTNDLVYLTAAKDLSYLPTKYYRYLPLFNSCLTNLAGTESTTITELENKIQKSTGGISFSSSAKTDPFNIGRTNMKYVISGMALLEKSPQIYELWFDILNNTKFNADDELVVDKLHTLIKNLGQNQLNLIADRGHSYANAYGNAKLSPTKHINDMFGGIEQVKLVMELNKNLEERGKDYLREEILPILKEIQGLVTSGFVEGGPAGFNYNIVAGKTAVEQNEKLIQKFESDMEKANDANAYSNALESLISSFTPSKPVKTILNFPFQVGYSSLAKIGAGYTTKDGAALQVLSQIVSFKHLHSVIREANGAYGGGLNFDGLGGTLNFYSYRDPNALKSTQAFAESAGVVHAQLADGNWGSEVLQEAKLAIFQSVDAPSHISSQGASLFLEGITDEMRQVRRERFLDVTVQDLQEVADKYLASTSNDVYTVVGDTKILGASDDWNVQTL